MPWEGEQSPRAALFAMDLLAVVAHRSYALRASWCVPHPESPAAAAAAAVRRTSLVGGRGGGGGGE